MALLEIKNLSFSYPNSKNNVLKNINLTVNEGEFCVLIGKSGSGKSTLLKLLKKEIAPYGNLNGEILFSSEKIGFVNQNVESNIVTDTVLGELSFAPQNYGKSREKINLKVAEVSNYFNLNNYIGEKIENLSGGSKQIISLASVMTMSPNILLLDEPASQLDPVSAENFVNTVIKLNKEQGITVIISEHNIANVLPFADKIIVLENGSVSFCGTPLKTAKFLVESDSEIKDVLPPYTFLTEDREIYFSNAKKFADKIKEKSAEPYVKGEKSLVAKNISFAYKKGLKDVFFSLDYSAEKGKINTIIGANGSGKTTLLKCLSNVLKCYSGKIKAKGKTAYLPQNVQTLFLKDTVLEEVPDKNILKKFDLDKYEEQSPFDLSGGEAQRLALAKVISLNADIILLDEPTKSIDVVFKNDFANMLKELAKSGKTIIIVTHDLEFAGKYSDVVSFLFDGKIIASAPRREFFSSLDVYTTSLSRLTNGRAVSLSDVEVAKWKKVLK